MRFAALGAQSLRCSGMDALRSESTSCDHPCSERPACISMQIPLAIESPSLVPTVVPKKHWLSHELVLTFDRI